VVGDVVLDARGAGSSGCERRCRHLPRRLERDLLATGERIVRVPPKLMAHVRDSARTFGKSDPTDAPAVSSGGLARTESAHRPP
jgi:hypothetical protein